MLWPITWGGDELLANISSSSRAWAELWLDSVLFWLDESLLDTVSGDEGFCDFLEGTSDGFGGFSDFFLRISRSLLLEFLLEELEDLDEVSDFLEELSDLCENDTVKFSKERLFSTTVSELLTDPSDFPDEFSHFFVDSSDVFFEEGFLTTLFELLSEASDFLKALSDLFEDVSDTFNAEEFFEELGLSFFELLLEDSLLHDRSRERFFSRDLSLLSRLSALSSPLSVTALDV